MNTANKTTWAVDSARIKIGANFSLDYYKKEFPHAIFKCKNKYKSNETCISPYQSQKICCQLDENRLCSFLDREGSHKMLTFTLIARTHMPHIAEPRRKSMTVLRSRSTTTTKTNFETRTKNTKTYTDKRLPGVVQPRWKSMTVL